MATEKTFPNEDEIGREFWTRFKEDGFNGDADAWYSCYYFVKDRTQEIQEALKEARDYISLDITPNGDVPLEAKMIIKQIDAALEKLK